MWLPFFVSTEFYAILLCVALVRIDAITHGSQIYLLDDTYIHLAIAKNLLLHGVYGISATESAMASSSILWPVLVMLTAKLVGLKLILPLILNIIAGLAMLAMAQYFLSSSGVVSQRWQILTLLLLVLAFPMVAMTLDGMEHILYGFAFIYFLWIAGLMLTREDTAGRWRIAALLFSAALLTSTRYEGSFAVFVFCVLLVWRRPFLAVATALSGLFPLVCFGIFSRRHGGMWVPNSLVMKTLDRGSSLQQLFRIPHELSTPYICEIGLTGLLLFLVFMSFLSKRIGMTSTDRNRLFLYLGVAALHIQFARLRTATPRYESYLVGAGVLLASSCLFSILRFQQNQNRPFPISIKAFAILAVLPIVIYRGVWWEIASVNGAVSIYRQQYQAAQFFAKYYPDQPIVANDVGAVSYFANVHCFDIWGLGNNDVARERANGTFTTAEIRRMAVDRHVDVGFVYDKAFFGAQSLPPEWIDVATWTIPTHHGNTTFASTISFYATSQSAASVLLRDLKAYQQNLPPEVKARTLESHPTSSGVDVTAN
jgi:hypothetical protein